MFKYYVQRNFNFLKSKTNNFLINSTQSSVKTFFNPVSNKNFFNKIFHTSQFSNTNNLIMGSGLKQVENVLIKYQKFEMRSMKSKRKLRAPNTKYKITNHTGLMKRIKIVGPRWNRGFKFWPVGHSHKMTNKSSGNLKRKKQARYICHADIRRIKRLIPYFMRRKTKRS
jgi:ribosomal protein L35